MAVFWESYGTEDKYVLPHNISCTLVSLGCYMWHYSCHQVVFNIVCVVFYLKWSYFLTMKTFNRKGLKTPGTNPDLKFRKTVPPDLMRVATWILLWIPLCQQSVMSAVKLQEGWNIFFIPTAAGYRFLSSCLWSFLQWLLYSWWVHTYFVPPQFRFKRAELSHLYNVFSHSNFIDHCHSLRIQNLFISAYMFSVSVK